jgi:hypothetical protein
MAEIVAGERDGAELVVLAAVVTGHRAREVESPGRMR